MVPDRRQYSDSAIHMNVGTSNNGQLDELVENFERDWDSSRTDQIERFVVANGLEGNFEFLVELIRSEIDLRYAAGKSFELSEYFSRFPALLEDVQYRTTVCFEDFRARRHRGYECRAERWLSIDGISTQSWMQALLMQSVSDEIRTATQSERVSPERVSNLISASDDSAALLNRLGDFELLAELGRGAFSRVYLARQVSLAGRYVAVKVVSRPLDEPTHLARLQHTGIVPLYSCHQVHGRWILCMPYHGAATLSDWLRGNRDFELRNGQSIVDTVQAAQLRITETAFDDPCAGTLRAGSTTRETLQSWHDAAVQPLHQLRSLGTGAFGLWMFRRIASALAHAHQRGIVHGDLKPANILIRNDGEPALIDFNLSRDTSNGPRHWLGGTLPYMAPEQLACMMTRSAGSSRAESDVFALGVIIYELIEGRLPYGQLPGTAESDLSVAIEQRKQAPAFRRGRFASEGLKAIVRKCLSPSQVDRYPSASELHEDLELEAAHLPLKYAKESWIRSRLPKIVRRYPRLFPTAIIMLMSMTIIGTLAFSLHRSRARSERLTAVEAFSRFQSFSDQAFIEFITTDGNRVSNRPEDETKSITEATHSLGISPKEDFGSRNWASISAAMTETERNIIEDRLLALAFIGSHRLTLPRGSGRLRDGNIDVLRSEVASILAELPDRTKHTNVVRAASSIINRGEHRPDRQIEVALEVNAASQSMRIDVPADQVLTAVLKLIQKQPGDALELLDNVEAPESMKLIYWMTRGRAQMEQTRYRDAITAFSMAMRYAQSSSAPVFNRGLSWMRLGSYEDARHDFSEAIRLEPLNSDAYVNRFAALTAMGRPKDALQDIDRAIELNPESNRLRLIRSRVLRQAGRLVEAKEDFDAAMSQQPRSIDDSLSVALARLPDQPEEALNDLKAAEALHGPDVSILQTIAHIYSEYLKRPDDAIETLNRLLIQDPEFQKAIAGRAVLHARAGHTHLALNDIQSLYKLSVPPTAESLYQAACSYALCSTGQPDLSDAALQTLAKAVQRGYGGDLLLSDPDLNSIRNTPEFRAIVSNYKLISSPE
ncbi:MAG: protein kinase [Planctomyces sp.]|nr:protein kinase [Planctomyces sp.]